jgi:hypothetical protein
MLDVIEHIENDENVLNQAHDYLAPQGRIVITVPAYQFLWSQHDVANHHKRRYTRRELRKKLEASGYRIEKLSYMNTILFPAALLWRMVDIMARVNKDPTLEIPSQFVNASLGTIFSFEKYLLRLTTMPFGLSVVAVAQR